MINLPVLVLNQNYEPLNVCRARRAVVLLWRGKAEVLENNSNTIHSASLTIPLPSVIRLIYLIRRPRMQRKLSRREVFNRDSYSCQYCGKPGPPNELTLDHILPQSRGGKSVWENLVTCCRKCNTKKGDMTPKEAGMKVLSKPKPLNSYFYLQMVRSKARDNQYWRKYLYY